MKQPALLLELVPHLGYTLDAVTVVKSATPGVVPPMCTEDFCSASTRIAAETTWSVGGVALLMSRAGGHARARE